MHMTKKIPFFLSLTLIFALSLGAPARVAKASEAVSQSARYAILDSITYGIHFGDDNRAYCFATGSAGTATKFVVSGDLYKKYSDNTYQLICHWAERTTNNVFFVFDNYALEATPGEYCFTLYVDVYKGLQRESLIFTKIRTKS